MALPATTVWEVRTDGNDANGGGFVTGASGPDRSQQAAAQIAYTDLVIGVTTTNLTSALNAFTAAEVGNILNVTGGVGFTTGRYQVVSVAAGVATMDRSVGVAASTGGTGNLGGALLTIAQALTLSTVDQMATYVRGGTYAITVALAPPARGSSTPCRCRGYSTIRGDLGRPTISVTAAVVGLTGATGWVFENLILDGTSTGTTGINDAGGNATYKNIKVTGFTGTGVVFTSNTLWDNIEVTGCAAGITSAAGADVAITGAWVHNNTGVGVSFGGRGCTLRESIISNNTGAAADGVSVSTGSCNVSSCIIYGNGRDGIRVVAGALVRGGGPIRNNVCVNNGGYGLNSTTALVHLDFPWIDYNAFYNNTSGAWNNVNASPHDVTLTGDPFTNAAGNDFSLNNTAGAGAACRNAGFPGALPGLATPLGYADIGVYRHQDPAQGPMFRGATL